MGRRVWGDGCLLAPSSSPRWFEMPRDGSLELRCACPSRPCATKMPRCGGIAQVARPRFEPGTPRSSVIHVAVRHLARSTGRSHAGAHEPRLGNSGGAGVAWDVRRALPQRKNKAPRMPPNARGLSGRSCRRRGGMAARSGFQDRPCGGHGKSCHLRLLRVNGPPVGSLLSRIRITPVGPDVEIRNTGPPGTGGDSESSWTRPDPPTICTVTPSGTRTSSEPQVSRRRLIRWASQLAAVRSRRAVPTPVIIVVSAPNCQPRPRCSSPSGVCSTRGSANRRAAGVSRTNGGSANIASSRSPRLGAAKTCSRTPENCSKDNSPPLNRWRSRLMAATRSSSSTPSRGAGTGRLLFTRAILAQIIAEYRTTVRPGLWLAPCTAPAYHAVMG
jgi:hypothetical protein